MQTITTAKQFNKWRIKQKNSVGFIPTLGALHKGHLSLIQTSQSMCQLTVVSIFLNPTQFSENEDLSSYPSTITKDIDALKKLQVDILFLPNEKEMYECVDDVAVPEQSLFQKLEGTSRPHFFYGVTTIVAKLFNVINPSHVFFGQKDAQQLIIIQQMIHDMKYPIELVACPTIRNKHGLALSSRNQYLTKLEQKKAAIIYKGLMYIKNELKAGINNPCVLKDGYKQFVEKNIDIKVDYISIADQASLEEVKTITKQQLLISTAVFFKSVRLIDNFTYSASDT